MSFQSSCLRAPLRWLGPCLALATACSDPGVAPHRLELLELAFRTASAIPRDPHHKDRARAQEAVVRTALELGQPALALHYLEQIEGWRRAACHAELARVWAEQGAAGQATHHAAIASRLAEEYARTPNVQSWPRERIEASLAATRTMLECQRRPPRAAAAADAEPERFALRLAAVDQVFAGGEFDQVRGALDACVELYDQYFDHDQQREQVRSRVASACRKLPVTIRSEKLRELAKVALRHGNQPRALEIVEAAHGLLASGRWQTEDKITLAAELVALRAAAGAPDRARREAEALRDLFGRERSRIVDIYRAGALRALAEAWHALGDQAIALQVYALAAEEGVANPNSRPRAEDLVATCCSLARVGVEPDPGLWRRLLQISDGLGQPW